MTTASPSLPSDLEKRSRKPKERLRSRGRTERLSTYLLAGLIAFGLFLRIYRVDLPETFTFDEALFVKNAHHYLIGAPDENDHPPLGKILMALGHLAFDYNSLGWRFTSLCFGVLAVYIAFLLGEALFDHRRAGYFAAALVSADGFFIAYSRAGLLDGVLCCFILWTLLAAVTAKSFTDVLLTGVLLGLATSIKWSGAFAVFPAALALVLLQRLPLHWVLGLGVSLIVHAVVWMIGLRMTSKPDDLASLWTVIQKLFEHHLALGNRQNELASRWYSWIYLYHPIVVKLSAAGIKSRYASSVGNPLIWALASLSVIALPVYFGLRRASLRFGPELRRRLPKLPELPTLPQLLEPRAVRAVLVLASGWLMLMSPWMVARGTYTFYYHYLPSYACAVLVVAGGLAALERKRPDTVFAVLWLSVMVVAYFTPVWGEFPISERSANRRLLFKPWQP